MERNDKTPAGKKVDLSLREKEKLFEKDLRDGISYQAGGVTVLELVERYISLKTKVRPTIKAGYDCSALGNVYATHSGEVQQYLSCTNAEGYPSCMPTYFLL